MNGMRKKGHPLTYCPPPSPPRTHQKQCPASSLQVTGNGEATEGPYRDGSCAVLGRLVKIHRPLLVLIQRFPSLNRVAFIMAIVFYIPGEVLAPLAFY